jgi:hypothetical protein
LRPKPAGSRQPPAGDDDRPGAIADLLAGSANKAPIPSAMAGTGRPAPRKRLRIDDERWCGRRLRWRLLIKSASNSAPATTLIPPHFRAEGIAVLCDRAGILAVSDCSATLWSPICADRSPAIPTIFRRRRHHLFGWSMSTGRI